MSEHIRGRVHLLQVENMFFLPVTLPAPEAVEVRVAVEFVQHELRELPTVRRIEPSPAAKPRVEIGSRWVPSSIRPMPLAPDAQTLQDALLDARTDPAYVRPLLAVVAGRVWNWL
jgi:hypothetical protein